MIEEPHPKIVNQALPQLPEECGLTHRGEKSHQFDKRHQWQQSVKLIKIPRYQGIINDVSKDARTGERSSSCGYHGTEASR